MSIGARMALLVLGLLLAACAGPRHRPGADPARMAMQEAREQALAGVDRWRLQGRIAVRGAGDEGGSGSFEWVQDGDRFTFRLQAPVTGRTWQLRGAPGQAVLEGLRAGPVTGPDAAILLQRELAWDVPLAALRHWVLGLRAGPGARIGLDYEGLPAVIEESGWRVEYRAWDSDTEPPLPTRLFARRGDDEVRLAISVWEFP